MNEAKYLQLEQQRNEIHQLEMKQLEELVEKLRDDYKITIQAENAQAFLFLMGVCYEIIECLQRISLWCAPWSGLTPRVDPGILDDEFQRLKTKKAVFQDRCDRFIASTMTNSDCEEQTKLLKKVRDLLSDQILTKVVLKLPSFMRRAMSWLCPCFNTTREQQPIVRGGNIDGSYNYPPIRTQPQFNVTTQQPTLEQVRVEESRRQADRALEEEYIRSLEENKRRRQEMMIAGLQEIERTERDFDRDRRIREQESKLHFDRQLQHIRDENARKDREMNLQMARLPERDVVVFESDRRRRQELEREQMMIEQSIRSDKSRHETEMAAATRELDLAQQNHEARMQSIEYESNKRMEQLINDAELKQAQLKMQFEQIEQKMQMRIWNEIIERNWTDRLNTLRDANRESKNLATHCLRGSFNPTKVQEWRLVLDILRKAMNDESLNMSTMYTSTGKSFLLQIKSSVDDVAQKCEELRNALSNPADIRTLLSLSSKLDRSCAAIPTLAELKHNYYSEMRN